MINKRTGAITPLDITSVVFSSRTRAGGLQIKTGFGDSLRWTVVVSTVLCFRAIESSPLASAVRVALMNFCWTKT